MYADQYERRPKYMVNEQPDAVADLDFSKIAKEHDFWHKLATKATYLEWEALTFLHKQGIAHLDRYGASAYGTRRAFLIIFRAYWSTGRLGEAKALAWNMAYRLGPSPDVSPDAFLIWKTLAADVMCRLHLHNRSKAAKLYGDLAAEYAIYEGASSKSYEYLHRALQAFYEGKGRWEMALHYVTSASESLDRLRRAPPKHATETIVERRLTILVTKATLLECVGNAAAAVRTYSDIMATCAEDPHGPDVHVESWHQFADRRIMVLRLMPQNQVPRDERLFSKHEGNLTGSGAATLLSLPTPRGGSHEGTSISARWQAVKDLKCPQGLNSIGSRQPEGKSTQTQKTIHRPPPGRGAIKVSKPCANKGSSAPAGSSLKFSTKKAYQVPQRRGLNNNNNRNRNNGNGSSNTSSNMASDTNDMKPYLYYHFDETIEGKVLDLKRFDQARKAANAMNRGDYSGQSLFDGQQFVDGRPALLARDPGSPSGDDSKDDWSLEEAEVLVDMAEGAICIRSDTVFRMVWCYANRYGREYVLDAFGGKEKEEVEMGKGKGKETAKMPFDDAGHCGSLEYFVRARSQVLGEPDGDLRPSSSDWDDYTISNGRPDLYPPLDVDLTTNLFKLHRRAVQVLQDQRREQGVRGLFGLKERPFALEEPGKPATGHAPQQQEVARQIGQPKEEGLKEERRQHASGSQSTVPSERELSVIKTLTKMRQSNAKATVPSPPVSAGPASKNDQSVRPGLSGSQDNYVPGPKGFSDSNIDSDSDSDIGLAVAKLERKRSCPSPAPAPHRPRPIDPEKQQAQHRDENESLESTHPGVCLPCSKEAEEARRLQRIVVRKPQTAPKSRPEATPLPDHRTKPQPQPAPAAPAPGVVKPWDYGFTALPLPCFPPRTTRSAARQTPPQPPPPRRQGSVEYSWEIVRAEQCQEEAEGDDANAEGEKRELELDGEKTAGGSRCSAM
ncbi:uncharacterized protein PG998_010585 [Apiospora kogelbergensis]|uniref:uncharacterized protein n=1 Tax=Apiospora kogelbergensis TaxID=1337665 RepID=UPI00312EA583